MSSETHDLDLAGMRLSPGEGRRMEFEVPIEPVALGQDRYEVTPPRVPVSLDISRMIGGGYALRLGLAATLEGPCMRCLKEARHDLAVEAREADRPGGGEELDSPYVSGESLDLAAWARDALVLSLPVRILCREDCAGLCPVCAADLGEAGPDHHHEKAPDPRWAKLSELELE
jgi:uncharacterized protein